MLSAVEVPAGEAVAEALELELGDPVAEIVRVRLADREPFALERSSFPLARFPGLLELDLTRLALRPAAEHYARAADPRGRASGAGAGRRRSRPRLSRSLAGAPLMLVERTAYAATGDAVEFARDLFRGDRTRIVAWASALTAHMTDDRAQVVVIGGGIAGVSVAYHLAREGVRDVLLLEKGELTSGSTHHAAGLVTQFNPSPTMMRFRRYSVELYRELGVFETVGSLRMASSQESLLELRRGVSRARGHRARRRARLARGGRPAACPRPARSRSTARSGCPVTATSIRTSRRTPSPPPARELGVAHSHGDAGDRHRARSARRGAGACVTDAAGSRRSTVVNACGIWAPQVAAMVGAFTPSIPVDHQHVTLHAVAGHELRAGHALLPRHRQPRLRQGRVRRRHVRRLRAGPGGRWARRRALGAREPSRSAGSRRASRS